MFKVKGNYQKKYRVTPMFFIPKWHPWEHLKLPSTALTEHIVALWGNLSVVLMHFSAAFSGFYTSILVT